jgi:hypothetical protein
MVKAEKAAEQRKEETKKTMEYIASLSQGENKDVGVHEHHEAIKQVSGEAGEENAANDKDKPYQDITSQLKDDTHQTEILVNKAVSETKKEMNKPKPSAKP